MDDAERDFVKRATALLAKLEKQQTVFQDGYTYCPECHSTELRRRGGKKRRWDLLHNPGCELLELLMRGGELQVLDELRSRR